MKKLIDRFKGRVSRARAAASEPAEEAGFFSTQFNEGANQVPARMTWAARAAAVDAVVFDPVQAVQLFARLWRQDQHTVALDDSELERLGRYLQFAKVAAGKSVIGQDEQGDYMLIVLDGALAIDRFQPWGAQVRLAEAKAGDMLGEMSLLDAGARFSACSTLTPCVLAVLDAASLDQMIRQEPKLALALLASLSRRLSLRLRQASARLSALLSHG